MSQEAAKIIESIPTYLNGWLVTLGGFFGAILWVFRLHAKVERIEGKMDDAIVELRYLRTRIDTHFNGDKHD